MSDIYHSNRKHSEAYKKELQEKISCILHPEEFASPGKADPQKFYLEFKNRILPLVQTETGKLEKETPGSDNCHLLLLKRTALVDVVVEAGFRTALWFYNLVRGQNLKEQDIPVAIVARGGYGRQEMYFRSDIDLQIVSKSNSEEKEMECAREITKYFEYLFVFQDIFPAPSSSCYIETQKLEEELGPEKIFDFFSLMEHRFIVGNQLVYTELKSSIKTVTLLHKEAILKHCSQFSAYYDIQNTVFRQEPNIKEELRRLYWALVMVRVRLSLATTNQFELLNELFDLGILSAPAFKNMQYALNFVSKVRLLLHSAQKGAYRDVLSYEIREKIAQGMGYELKDFYKEYFRQAVYPLKRYSRNLFWESMTSDTEQVDKLSENFALNAEDQIIFIPGREKIFSTNPQWIFKVFTWVAEKNYYLSYPIIRSIEDHVGQMFPISMEEDVRKEIQDYFQRIIRGKYYAKAIRLLHEFGLLGGYYIPDFKNISGLLQDIYVHKFPTDLHVLAALDALNRLELDEEADPFLVELYHSQKDKTTLKLAVILHDIGKGAKIGDENEELVGARMVPGILQNLGYAGKPQRLKDTVFLVEKHLMMYDLMLLDPEDDDTFDMVFDLVDQDKERLKMLVLLTYADRAGTKMSMTPIQIQQLKQFYHSALYHKKRQTVSDAVKLDFFSMVRLPRELQSQLEIYNAFPHSKYEFEAEMIYKSDRAVDLIVCTKDQKRALFNIATVLAFNQLSIVEADIQTLHGTVFDVFKVIGSSGALIEYSNFFFVQKQVKDDLLRIFVEKIPPSLVFKGRSLSTKHIKSPYKDVKLKIKIIGRAVKLETHDIIGNFMMETKVFSQLDMEIQKAVLHSHNGTASNIFYLRATDVEKIISHKEHFLNTLTTHLRQLIESPSTLLEEHIEVT